MIVVMVAASHRNGGALSRMPISPQVDDVAVARAPDSSGEALTQPGVHGSVARKCASGTHRDRGHKVSEMSGVKSRPL